MSKIKMLLDVVEDMKSLADSLEILANSIEEPEDDEGKGKPELIDKAVEEEKMQTEEEGKDRGATESRQYKMEDVRRALSAKSSAGKTAQVKELLLQHGASKLSAIDPSEYTVMMEEAEKL